MALAWVMSRVLSPLISMIWSPTWMSGGGQEIVNISQRENVCAVSFFKRFFGGLFRGFTDRQLKMWTGNGGEREGELHAANGRGWNRTHGRSSEDISPVYGALALPNELPGAPCAQSLMNWTRSTFRKSTPCNSILDNIVFQALWQQFEEELVF